MPWQIGARGWKNGWMSRREASKKKAGSGFKFELKKTDRFLYLATD